MTPSHNKVIAHNKTTDKLSAYPKKAPTREPYAAIEWRIIDSPAYADLTGGAVRLLTIMTRQLTRDNNGYLQATFAYCQPRGISSEHTLRDAIADLITHGFIYRTRSHGANRAWARYAVTWLSITKKDGLFLAGFVPCAWRNWQPDPVQNKKSSPQKVPDNSGRKCSFNIQIPAESAGSRAAESADYELLPIQASSMAVEAPAQNQHNDQHDQPPSDYRREPLDDMPPVDYADCVKFFGSDTEPTENYLDEERGEFIQRPSSKKPRSAEIERIKASIAAMQT